MGAIASLPGVAAGRLRSWRRAGSEADEKAHVFGFHTGNKIATELAAGWPSRIDNLILCGHTHSMMAEHEALNAALGAVVASDLRKFAPEPDGSHLVKQWAAEPRLLSSSFAPKRLDLRTDGDRAMFRDPHQGWCEGGWHTLVGNLLTGIDVNLSKHVYVMVEGSYGDYGQYLGVNLQRRHFLAGAGFRF